MKISGFTFIRNGTLLGYPYIESLRSLLPLCDEVVVAVGAGQDDTLARIAAIGDPKLRVIETIWNESMQDRGYVYAQQKMIAQFNCSGDWAFYLEGDEVLHEEDIASLRATLQRYVDHPNVEALVFDYYHFYGSPTTLAISPGWYRRAVRVIRNSIRSYSPDGLFFVVMDKNKRGRYPYAACAGVPIYHYGHVRAVANMQAKIQQVSRYWGHAPPPFAGYGNIDPLALGKFSGSHPAVMRNWLAEAAEPSLVLNPNYQLTRRERRHRWMMRLERLFGWELSKKHYRLRN
ncbi:MAG: glycosyltransferase [Candidatus Parabeggiatoa sp. nov. 2]|nr:MAG: glycosyltransferase [Beggiatoa sp. 4572_84]RKZ63756.1 MAG: glycosyltransferase [Gammaproteobacteria bacterium]HEC83778.1 glycosyltransferase [Thioploca sp.]